MSEIADEDACDMFGLPVFVVNMDRCPDRLSTTMKRVIGAGFRNVKRFRAVDAADEESLLEAWKQHGNPKFDPERVEFVKYKGEQGCAVTHLNLWKHIIINNIEKAVVFEDDVFFHKDWDELAPEYWTASPQNFDILYLGSQIELRIHGDICQVPVYCTHAYVITKDGAQKLYNHLLSKKAFPKGICAIDSCLIETMWKTVHGQKPSFTWYVWNGLQYPDPKASEDKEWAKRNSGLVFQDPAWGTFVKPRNPEQESKLI